MNVVKAAMLNCDQQANGKQYKAAVKMASLLLVCRHLMLMSKSWGASGGGNQLMLVTNQQIPAHHL